MLQFAKFFSQQIIMGHGLWRATLSLSNEASFLIK